MNGENRRLHEENDKLRNQLSARAELEHTVRNLLSSVSPEEIEQPHERN